MAASTIVVAREDLSIPGSAETDNGAISSASDLEAHFFNVIRQYNPDVIVLDFTGPRDNGIAAILKVRRQTAVPILVVCRADDQMQREYCLAGAAECIQAPIDIMQLNVTVQKIIQVSKVSRPIRPAAQHQARCLNFAGMTLNPDANLLVGEDGASIKLTTSENRVLLHFVSNPWTLFTRDALADALYGPHRPNSDRAVDVIVTRLRKKMASLRGVAAQNLIKTEFRRGYVFVAEVSTGAAVAAPSVRRQADPPLRARLA
jgi:two-component system, OmpR family, response regulator